MKKLTIVGLVSALLIVALFAGLVVYVNYSLSHFCGTPIWSALQIELQTMTENSGFYNVYLTINASAPETINKFGFNKDVAGLTTYVNGSKLNAVNPPEIKLDSGDFIEVIFTIPVTQYTSVNELKVDSTAGTYGLNMPSSFEPYLVTNLGWYMHNSTDPVVGMANQFTIYGYVENTGATDAQNCSLALEFYKGDVLVQTSNIHLGEIKGFFNCANLNSTNIPCSAADFVTRTEVHLVADNAPTA